MDAVPKGKQDDLSVPAVQAVQYCDKLFMHERYCKEHVLWSSIFVTLVAKKYRFMQFELDRVFDTR